MLDVRKINKVLWIFGMTLIIGIIVGTTVVNMKDPSVGLKGDTAAVHSTNTKGRYPLGTKAERSEVITSVFPSRLMTSLTNTQGIRDKILEPATVMGTSSRGIASLKNCTTLTEWETYKCRPLKGSVQQGRFILTGLKNGKWDSDGFCVASQALNNTNIGNTYTYSVSLWNQVGKLADSHQSPNYGHPGIAFNILDESNYDLVYIRPHDRHRCYQIGYVKKGSFERVKENRCPDGPPKGRTWFTLKVIVEPDHVNVLLNGDSLIQYKPHFRSKPNVGVMLANGFQNQIYVKDAVISIND